MNIICLFSSCKWVYNFVEIDGKIVYTKYCEKCKKATTIKADEYVHRNKK